jgi:hypothetical protein
MSWLSRLAPVFGFAHSIIFSDVRMRRWKWSPDVCHEIAPIQDVELDHVRKAQQRSKPRLGNEPIAHCMRPISVDRCEVCKQREIPVVG